jgi:hypothetical protein
MTEDSSKFKTLTCLGGQSGQDALLEEIRRDVQPSSVLDAMKSYMDQLHGKLDNNARPYQKLARLFMAGNTPTKVEGHHYGEAIGLRSGDEKGIFASYGNFMGFLWGTTVGPTVPWVGKSFTALSIDSVSDYTGAPGDGSKPSFLGINHFERLEQSLVNRFSFSVVTFWMHLQDAPSQERALYGYDKNGGLFIAHRAPSVYAGTNREVFQLNYRWRQLGNIPPISYLIDEIVEIADGLYLGQLLFATKNVLEAFDGQRPAADYDYQHFGYFLLMDDSWEPEVSRVFPNIRLGDAPASGAPTPGAPAFSSKFTTLTLMDHPDGNCNDQVLAQIKNDMKGRATVLDLLKFYSDQLMEKFDNDSPYFVRMHELFNRGISPDEVQGYYRGAVVTFHAAGYYRLFNINALNAAWVPGKFFSPWTGKTFDPASPEQLKNYTDGYEQGTVPTFWGANTLVFRTVPQKFVREGMKIANVWMEDVPADETRRFGYEAKSFFFIAHKGTSVNEENGGKKVFLFNYRWPKLRTMPPDCYCIDELVQIAEGLYLGQLIYSTELLKKFDPAVSSAEYKYRLFGYFLLMDEEWQRRRVAIGLDPYNQ